VFYEVFVRSFADSDGDGIGDLPGVTAHLDDLNDGNPATTADLGITGLWLMPVAESASYHGYDVTDYRAIEHDYGDAADFHALVDAAHERGIKVVVDFVPNHTSKQNPWFRDAEQHGPHDAWYVWSPTDPGYAGPDGQQVWHRDEDGRFYYGVFGDGLPDLNLRNPDVTKELHSIAKYWLEDMGVDGLRVDAAKHLLEDGEKQTNTAETKAWLTAFRDDVHGALRDSLVLGEVWDPRGITSSYPASGAVDLVFDFEVGGAILGSVRLGDAGTLKTTESELGSRYPPGSVATFLSNHDQPRFMSQLSGDATAAKAAAAALLLAPGVPFVYYGEELGMTGTKPDERIRTPYPWTASAPGFGFTSGTPWEQFGDNAVTANVESERKDGSSLLATYRDLIRVRTSHPALSSGTVVPLDSSPSSVAAFLRRDATETLVVIHALSKDAVSGATLDVPAEALCGRPTGDVIYGPAGAPRTIVPPIAGTEWRLPDLPGRSSWVIRLSP
ncbi:MAG TPA: alpha-amylase family glycosyl hydrolase, partial [Candidatus Limnocylindrales bacterium]|nr:alpha-amylase family glycosyl hydrolase [Candidatus Limnocylindrales bacterium]